MDDRGMFNLAKPNEWCAIEDLMVFATVVNDEAPCRGLDPRLQRHFVVINVPPLKGQCLTTIVTAWTEVRGIWYHPYVATVHAQGKNSCMIFFSVIHVLCKPLQDHACLFAKHA